MYIPRSDALVHAIQSLPAFTNSTTHLAPRLATVFFAVSNDHEHEEIDFNPLPIILPIAIIVGTILLVGIIMLCCGCGLACHTVGSGCRSGRRSKKARRQLSKQREADSRMRATIEQWQRQRPLDEVQPPTYPNAEAAVQAEDVENPPPTYPWVDFYRGSTESRRERRPSDASAQTGDPNLPVYEEVERPTAAVLPLRVPDGIREVFAIFSPRPGRTVTVGDV